MSAWKRKGQERTKREQERVSVHLSSTQERADLSDGSREANRMKRALERNDMQTGIDISSAAE